MQIENDEILCIPGREKDFAVEYPYIQELCSEMKISDFPCLPPFFMGLINYKGNIIPLMMLEKREKVGTAWLTLVVRGEKHMMGILMEKEPYIVHKAEIGLIDAFPESEETSFWKVKGGVQLGEKVFRLIDVEKTIDSIENFK